MFEGGFRVPLIVRWPKIIATNTRIQHFVSQLDIFPTLCDIVNISLPSNIIFDGRSILSLLTKNDHSNNNKDNVNFAYFCGEQLLAVRTGKHKVYFGSQKWLDEDTQSCKYQGIYGACSCTKEMINIHDPPLLYDLEYDPSEKFILTYSNYPSYQLIVNSAMKYKNYIEDSLEQVPNQLRKIPLPHLQPCCQEKCHC